MKLENEIERLVDKLENMSPVSEDYAVICQRILELKQAETFKSPKNVSFETILTVGASVFEILAIMFYEQGHVIATKALSRVIRPRF